MELCVTAREKMYFVRRGRKIDPTLEQIMKKAFKQRKIQMKEIFSRFYLRRTEKKSEHRTKTLDDRWDVLGLDGMPNGGKEGLRFLFQVCEETKLFNMAQRFKSCAHRHWIAG